jgi:hypothetical protein
MAPMVGVATALAGGNPIMPISNDVITASIQSRYRFDPLRMFVEYLPLAMRLYEQGPTQEHYVVWKRGSKA